jgi:hypothetical protein
LQCGQFLPFDTEHFDKGQGQFGMQMRCKTCVQSMRGKKPDRQTCTKCGIEKPFDAEHFPAHPRMPFGLRKYCSDCFNVWSRDFYKGWRHELRLEVLTHYSGGTPTCHCCGIQVWEWLALDHLEGGSQEDYRKYGNFEKFFSHLKRSGYSARMTVSCHNCNAARSIFGHCCVHRPEDKPEGLYVRKGGRRTIFLVPLNVNPDDKTTRRCQGCKRVFPVDIDHFYSNSRTRCKECQSRGVTLRKRERTAAARLKAMTYYCGGTPYCMCCGLDSMPFLTIDHVNGGGKKHREQEGFNDICDWLIKHGLPSGFATLCYSCNMSKGFFRRCPCQGMTE